ncbi:hypothetical protein JX266_006597 [Neoarthrinium moseri]|nr:hypothetical protein JX266_006597 [Neoarthrinium moseri]
MGKVKQANGKASKSADPLSAVKSAGVSKASASPVAKSKKLAKDVATKAVTKSSKKDSKKSKKVESDSESSDSSDSESASDEEMGSDNDSDDSDSDSDSSESEEEKKPAAKKAKAAPATNGKAKKAAESSDDSDSSESEDDKEDSDDSSDDDEEEDAVKKAEPAVAKGKKVKADSDDSDDDSEADSDDSDSSDSDEEEEEEKAEPSKKRKAEDEVATPAKKTKSENTQEDGAVTLFVGNLGWGIDDDALYNAFKDCAGLNSARVVTDKDMQRSRGFGYVDFDSPENCQAAFEAMQGFELEGRGMRLDPSKPKPADDGTPRDRAANRAQQHGDTVSPESDTLFVGNLPFEADEDVISEFFSDVAEVKSLRLPTDQESGNRKGFGYVTFNSVEDAKTAFEAKNGGYIGEGRGARAIRLDFAAQRQPQGF